MSSKTRIIFGTTCMEVPVMGVTSAGGSGENKAVRDLTVPTWAINLAKFCTPAILALVGMYYSIKLLQKDVETQGVELKTMQKESDVHKDEIRDLKHNLDLVKKDENNAFEKIGGSLQRIEIDMKEVKKDVKDLQLQQVGR